MTVLTSPPPRCGKQRLFPFFLALVLFGALWLTSPRAHASSLSYGYNLLLPQEGGHHLFVSDGYCHANRSFFDRICFELGASFRFAPFFFDLSPQVVFHHLWFTPRLISGFYFSAGPLFELSPAFQAGFRLDVGFHIYFVSPSIEFQLGFDTEGKAYPRLFLQLKIILPTGSINFFAGNVGL